MPPPPWTQKIGGLPPFGWIGTSDVQRLSAGLRGSLEQQCEALDRGRLEDRAER